MNVGCHRSRYDTSFVNSLICSPTHLNANKLVVIHALLPPPNAAFARGTPRPKAGEHYDQRGRALHARRLWVRHAAPRTDAQGVRHRRVHTPGGADAAIVRAGVRLVLFDQW